MLNVSALFYYLEDETNPRFT